MSFQHNAFQGNAFQAANLLGFNAAFGIPVTLMDSGGFPVIAVTALGEPGIVVASGGMGITLVSDFGRPMVL